MNAHARAIWTIARRDYVATVWSRSFLFFLIFPILVPAISGGVAVLTGGQRGGSGAPGRAIVRVAMDAPSFDALADARASLADRLGPAALPEVSREAPRDAPLLFGSLDHPHLAAPAGRPIRDLSGDLGLIVDRARSDRALGRAAPAPVRFALFPRPMARDESNAREALGHGAQLVLFFLIMMLAGMMISNLVEEKSSKVIELLLAAVPVDAVFAGKLLGMLMVSLTGVAVWGTLAVVAVAAMLPPDAMPSPAIGWPMFAGLALLYYVMAFSLFGGLYLGIGAQAATVREVQTISLPLTFGQVGVLALAAAAVAHPDRPLALVADVVPWTSPYAMLARAAIEPRIWPHMAALVWQGLAVALTIRVGAGLFRTNILKSGGRRRKPRVSPPRS